MKDSDRLVLADMSFRACHGVLPQEKRRRQEFRVTVELELPLARAGRSDRLADALDYRAVQATVRAVVEGAHRHLIEALAEDIARELLAGFPRVRAVVVDVLKPSPPVDFIFSGVRVRLRRER